MSFTVADLLRDDGWDAAVDGVSFVLHVASPMPIREYRNTDLVKPAREGVRRVMRAAKSAGVLRVIMTSSVVAASPSRDRADDAASDESGWTDPDARGATLYSRSKTLAERDAWELSRTGAGPPLTTILPSSIQGPVLQRSVSGSVELVQRLLTGAVPAIPRIGFAVVDIRDLVDLQIRAMRSSAATGERFIASGDFLWYREMAAILRSEFGPQAARVPTRELPDIVVRAAALVSFEARFIAPSLGKRNVYSSAKAHHLLGWLPRAAGTSIVDSAASMFAMSAV